MKLKTIAFFEVSHDEEKFFKTKLARHNLIFFDQSLKKNSASSICDAEILCIFIYSQITREILDNLPNLKYIITRSAGYDHIDLKACKQKGIQVLRVPAYGVNTVAEHTFALLLSLSRKVHNSYLRTRQGEFSLQNLQGFDLAGKTLGIIGLGNIGKRVAEIGRCFQMKVIAYDLFKDKKFAQQKNISYVTLRQLFRSADVLTLHCNYTKKNHHLINKKSLSLMKKNAVIINTARGSIVDTHALVEAIRQNKIGGAGLDVLEEEYLIKEEPALLKKPIEKSFQNTIKKLLDEENVIVTPHNAFNSIESSHKIMNTTIENVFCAIENKYCENRV